MRRRKMLAAGIAVVVAAAVFAAIGFGRGASAVPALGGGAEVAPADTAAFVALDTNMSSAQWQTLDGLFTVIGEQEQAIRKNPAARTTELLKKVFGSH